MALTYTSQKCDCCGGALEYDKGRRIWTCLYCGNEIVRQETYDGQFSIKWVARQALVSVANRDMEVAEEHIVECSKIDPHYVGTVIARLAYSVVSLSMTDNPDKRRRLLSQIGDYHAALRKTPLTPSSDEEIFYEGLDSSDAYGLLALLYDTLGDEAREEFVADCVDASSVYSASAAKDIVGYALSEGRYSLVDELVQSPAELDCDYAFTELLQRYPDAEGKVVNIQLVAARLTSKEGAQDRLDEYLATTEDQLSTRLSISKSCFVLGIKPTIGVCLSTLLPACSEVSQVEDVFEMACGTKLTDEDAAGVVSYCCATASPVSGAVGLGALKSSGQFVTVTQANVLSALNRPDLCLVDKNALIDRLYGFDLPERFRQSVVSAYVREGAPGAERVETVRYLAGTVVSLNAALVEDYLMHSAGDEAKKCEIVEILISKQMNASTLKRALSNYLAASPDSVETTQSVLRTFASRGLAPGEIDVVSYACRTGDDVQSLATVRSMKESGWETGPRALDGYLVSCTNGVRFSPELFAELYRQDSTISDEALCAYALHCVDRGTEKVARVRALAGLAGRAAGSQHCRVSHLGKTIGCTLLQGYMLASPDPAPVSGGVIQEMFARTGNTSGTISILDGSGTTTTLKFKRYLSANKESLQPATLEFAEKQKLLGGFF